MVAEANVVKTTLFKRINNNIYYKYDINKYMLACRIKPKVKILRITNVNNDIFEYLDITYI